jgi:hypothetical protein
LLWGVRTRIGGKIRIGKGRTRIGGKIRIGRGEQGLGER